MKFKTIVLQGIPLGGKHLKNLGKFDLEHEDTVAQLANLLHDLAEGGVA